MQHSVIAQHRQAHADANWTEKRRTSREIVQGRAQVRQGGEDDQAVLVVDPLERVAAVVRVQERHNVQSAHVRREVVDVHGAEGRGAGGAQHEGEQRVREAALLLLCHDDVAVCTGRVSAAAVRWRSTL